VKISELPNANRQRDRLPAIYKILIVALAAFAFWLMFRVREGEREFRESQQALRHVTSWRQEARVGAQVNQQAEIMCPDDERGPDQTTSHSKDGAANGVRVESVKNGPNSHLQTSGNLPDKSETAPKVTAPCEKLLHDEFLYPLPDYDHLIKHTKIIKGAVESVQGLKCQEWTTVRVIAGRFAPAQPFDDAQICIGLDDHLPRRIKYDKVEYIFYDWNTHIQVEGNQAPRTRRP
jgi:hypothetical protein